MKHRWTFPCTYKHNYDGDTIHLELDLGFGIYHRTTVVLDGVNAPELVSGTEQTTRLARKARDDLRSACVAADSLVFGVTKWRGNYGRPLGHLWADGHNLGKWLIDQGLALPSKDEDQTDEFQKLAEARFGLGVYK